MNYNRKGFKPLAVRVIMMKDETGKDGDRLMGGLLLSIL